MSCTSSSTPVALTAGEGDELLRPRGELTALRAARHGDAAAAAELEQPLVAQQPQRAQDRVPVDTEDGREVARRRQALALARLAVGDGPPDLGGDLVVEGGRIRLSVDATHGASDTSFIMTDLVLPLGRPHPRTLHRGVGPEATAPRGARRRGRRGRRRRVGVHRARRAPGTRAAPGGGAGAAARPAARDRRRVSRGAQQHRLRPDRDRGLAAGPAPPDASDGHHRRPVHRPPRPDDRLRPRACALRPVLRGLPAPRRPARRRAARDTRSRPVPLVRTPPR